jgi:hypothetical protein
MTGWCSALRSFISEPEDVGTLDPKTGAMKEDGVNAELPATFGRIKNKAHCWRNFALRGGSGGIVGLICFHSPFSCVLSPVEFLVSSKGKTLVRVLWCLLC